MKIAVVWVVGAAVLGLAHEAPEDAPPRDTIELTSGQVEELGLKVEPARPAEQPTTLVLSGILAIDPARLAHIRPRFSGEVVALGRADDHPLRAGDPVAEGQVLVTVWSSELSRLKNELLDDLSHLRMERERFDRLRELQGRGALPERTILEARRELEAAEIEAAKGERSLRARGASAEEVARVHAEAEAVRKLGTRSPFDPERSWGRFSLTAPSAGHLIETKAVLGDLIAVDEVLFRVADLSRLVVRARVNEADLHAIESLPTPVRWRLHPGGFPAEAHIEGTVETIGVEIDPADHTALLSGAVPNPTGALRPGQTIDAELALPADPSTVEIPDAAALIARESTWVFVQTSTDPPVFRLRPIHPTRHAPGLLAVRPTARGLHAGDRVVTAGAARLKARLDGPDPADDPGR